MEVSYQKSVEKKYQAILFRSYKTKLDVYLFVECIKKGTLENVSEIEFRNFRVNDEYLKLYKDACKLNNDDKLLESPITMREIDGIIEHYYKENRMQFFNVYKDDFIKVLSIEDLKKIYDKDLSERRCKYCGISESDILLLKRNKKIDTKRLRGNSLEFDRKEAFREYEKDNLVLACYWCNNAKTDEFSYDEFVEQIGKAFKVIWQNRKNSII